MFTVSGKDHNGQYTVTRPDGLLCNGTWKTRADAQAWCNGHNNKDTWKRLFDE